MINNKKLIVPVCRGNIARSAVAEALIKKEIKIRGLSDKYETLSRGVQGTVVDPQPVKFPNITYYKELYADSKPTLEKLEINLSKHISKPIDNEIAQKASILLAVDKKTQQALSTLFPEQKNKIHMLSELIGEGKEIIDPEGVSGMEKQEKIFTEIKNIIVNRFSKLIELVD